MSAVGRAEHVLGRRLRPWWGTSPSRLLGRGLVQGVILGVLGYAALGVLTGRHELPAELPVAAGTIRLVATLAVVLAALGLVYSLVRVVVGVLDLVPRLTVEGVVLSVVERELGDTLPWLVRLLLRARDRRHDRDYVRPRRTHLQLTLDTARGPQTWTIRGRFGQLAPGRRVRVTATPLLGYVTRVD